MITRGQNQKQKTEQAEIKQLRRQKELLQLLPDDFRDIVIGSEWWTDFKDLFPEKREEMEAWAHGPIYVVGDLGPKEQKLLLTSNKPIIFAYARVPPITVDVLALCAYLIDAIEEDYSFLYFACDVKQGFVDALNKVLSMTKAPLRVKTRITDSKGLLWDHPEAGRP